MSYVFVRTPSPDRALTAAQKRALLAMPEGAEVDAGSIAEAASLKPNGAALALRGLERRGLVARDEDAPSLWSVTFAGRALAQRLAAVEEGRGDDGTSGSPPLPSHPSSGP